MRLPLFILNPFSALLLIISPCNREKALEEKLHHYTLDQDRKDTVYKNNSVQLSVDLKSDLFISCHYPNFVIQQHSSCISFTMQISDLVQCSQPTLCFQMILPVTGLELTSQSKYTSSPSLILSSARLCPSESHSWGASENRKYFIWNQKLFQQEVTPGNSTLLNLLLTHLVCNCAQQYFIFAYFLQTLKSECSSFQLFCTVTLNFIKLFGPQYVWNASKDVLAAWTNFATYIWLQGWWHSRWQILVD